MFGDGVADMKQAFAGRSFLIVDDEEMLRDLLQSVFAAEGAKVTLAENGAKALEICRNQQFDALITDVRMPGGDGISLIRKLKAEATEIPFFFVCSGFNDLGGTTLTDLGISKVFDKPFNLREMLFTVKEFLSP